MNQVNKMDSATRPRRGRRKKNPGLSDTERRQLRAAQNREATRRSRERSRKRGQQLRAALAASVSSAAILRAERDNLLASATATSSATSSPTASASATASANAIVTVQSPQHPHAFSHVHTRVHPHPHHQAQALVSARLHRCEPFSTSPTSSSSLSTYSTTTRNVYSIMQSQVPMPDIRMSIAAILNPEPTIAQNHL